MPLKQSSFDFDFSREADAPEQLPVVQEPEKEFAAKVRAVNVRFKQQPVQETPVPAVKSTRGRMKLSDMSAQADKVNVPDDKELFEKSYYSIGAVSAMFKVNQSLIRYWENEFDILKPKKNSKGDRYFRPEDVKNLKLIYHLLRERKYTIDGAKAFLKKNRNAEAKFAAVESLKDLRSFLCELKANL